MLSVLAENFDILMSLDLFVITWSWFKIHSGFKYTLLSIFPGLSEYPQLSYGSGNNHCCPHCVLVYPFLHRLFELDINCE
jgi:hypothetical protein